MITDEIKLEHMHQKHEKRKILTLHYEQTINALIQHLEETETTKKQSPRTPLTPEERGLIKSRLKKQSEELKKSRESLDNLDSYGYSPNSCGSSADNLDIGDEAQEEQPKFQMLNKLFI